MSDLQQSIPESNHLFSHTSFTVWLQLITNINLSIIQKVSKPKLWKIDEDFIKAISIYRHWFGLSSRAAVYPSPLHLFVFVKRLWKRSPDVYALLFSQYLPKKMPTNLLVVPRRRCLRWYQKLHHISLVLKPKDAGLKTIHLLKAQSKIKKRGITECTEHIW